MYAVGVLEAPLQVVGVPEIALKEMRILSLAGGNGGPLEIVVIAPEATRPVALAAGNGTPATMIEINGGIDAF